MMRIDSDLSYVYTLCLIILVQSITKEGEIESNCVIKGARSLKITVKVSDVQ